jgi:hypothetical protein
MSKAKPKRIYFSKKEKAVIKSSGYFTDLLNEYKNSPTDENALWVVAVRLGINRFSNEDLDAQQLLVDGIHYGLLVATSPEFKA